MPVATHYHFVSICFLAAEEKNFKKSKKHVSYFLAIYSTIQGFGVNQSGTNKNSNGPTHAPIDTGVLAEERDPLQRLSGG